MECGVHTRVDDGTQCPWLGMILFMLLVTKPGFLHKHKKKERKKVTPSPDHAHIKNKTMPACNSVGSRSKSWFDLLFALANEMSSPAGTLQLSAGTLRLRLFAGTLLLPAGALLLLLAGALLLTQPLGDVDVLFTCRGPGACRNGFFLLQVRFPPCTSAPPSAPPSAPSSSTSSSFSSFLRSILFSYAFLCLFF